MKKLTLSLLATLFASSSIMAMDPYANRVLPIEDRIKILRESADMPKEDKIKVISGLSMEAYSHVKPDATPGGENEHYISLGAKLEAYKSELEEEIESKEESKLG